MATNQQNSPSMSVSYPVLRDIGPFKAVTNGKPTRQKKQSNVLAYYRAIADAGAAKPIALSVDTMVQCIESIEGDDQDAEDKRIVAMLRADGQIEGDADDEAEVVPEETDVTEVTEEAAKASEDAIASQTRSAAEFIDKAAGAPEVSTVLNTIVEASKTEKMKGILLLNVLRSTYSTAELDGAPMPGTKPDDVKGTNLLPEYTRKFTPKKDGGYREGWVSWFVTAAERIPAGKALADKETTLAKKLDTAKNVRDYGDKKDSGASFNKVVATLRQSIHLHHVLRACEGVPHLSAGWRTQIGADGKTQVPYRSQYPIEVMDMRDKSGATAIPLTTFLGLKPALVSKMTNEEIAKKGGLLSALLATGGTGAGESAGGPTKSTIKTRKDAEGTFAELSAWLHSKESTEALVKWLNEPAKDSDGLLRSVNEIYLELKPLYDAYHPRIQAMMDAETAASAAKIAALHNQAVKAA